MSSSLTSSSSSEAPAPASPFDGVGRIQCRAQVVLGTGRITVRQCLALDRQTVLRLDQSAGEDLRLDVAGVTIAFGEVAIIDTTTALRITDLAPAPHGGGE
jgi:flagellar motor switch/type III secretory pathway protein FliN